jgi:hypothetical protein
VPIAILINGKFWDAAAYKADPIPMALEPETVYEVERTGNSVGLFTVQSALHANGANAPVPWLGTGDWRPTGTESSNKPAKAEPVPAGLTATDAPPRLTRNPAAASGAATTGSGTPGSDAKPASAQPPAPSTPAGPSSSDEPPRLIKPAPAPPSSTPDPQPPPDKTSAPSGPSTSAPSSDKADAKPANTVNVPASDSGAKAANRPQLRRGKPVEAFAEEEIPGYSKPGKTASNTDKKTDTKADPDLESNVQIIPAISDASSSGPHSFTFDLYPTEEADRRKQMSDLAQNDLRAYINARTKATTTSTATKPLHPATKRTTAKPQDAVFENVTMTAFDLWNTNTAIIVFSADAHMPLPSNTAVAGSMPQYSILLVAYPDIYGNLRKLHSTVTDKFHLDMTPRLQLIDAVDADGDGRGELLFRETSDGGSGWVIYRASTDKLWKMFDSLNQE